MDGSIWKQAHRRALGDTLELVRLDKPSRAVLTFGVPIVALAVAYFMLGEFAIATAATVAAMMGLGATYIFNQTCIDTCPYRSGDR